MIVYHNDFNRIQLPSFTELEQNLLFTILLKIQNKKSGERIEIFANDLLETLTKNIKYGKTCKKQENENENQKQQIRVQNSREYFTRAIDTLKSKFFKADFRQIIETETEIIDKTINLFQSMEIYYTKRNPNDGMDSSKLFNRIVMVINPQFEYLISNISANFTQYELTEFLTISGKYAKTLYRLLKQYRDTGILKISWVEFVRIMDIPKSYKMCDIDKQILKPCIEELSRERIIFGERKIAFKNLYIKKNKENVRGHKVNQIEFVFDVEKTKKKKNEKPVFDIDSETKIDKFFEMLKTRYVVEINESSKMELLRAVEVYRKYYNYTIRLWDKEKQRYNFLKFVSFNPSYKVYQDCIIFENYKILYENSEQGKRNYQTYKNAEHLENFIRKNLREQGFYLDKDQQNNKLRQIDSIVSAAVNKTRF